MKTHELTTLLGWFNIFGAGKFQCVLAYEIKPSNVFEQIR